MTIKRVGEGKGRKRRRGEETSKGRDLFACYLTATAISLRLKNPVLSFTSTALGGRACGLLLEALLRKDSQEYNTSLLGVDASISLRFNNNNTH